MTTSVSWDVSRKLAEEGRKASRQSLGVFGPIEPELLGPLRRNVRSVTILHRQATRICFAITVLGTVLCNAVGTFFIDHSETRVAIVCGAILIVAVASLCTNHPFCNTRLLEKGIPSRAIVVAVENRSPDAYAGSGNDLLQFAYRYLTMDGFYRFGYFAMTRRRSWQLAITQGTTFTVLYSEDNPEEAMPYFLIPGQKIVGAIGAKISPA